MSPGPRAPPCPAGSRKYPLGEDPHSLPLLCGPPLALHTPPFPPCHRQKTPSHHQGHLGQAPSPVNTPIFPPGGGEDFIEEVRLALVGEGLCAPQGPGANTSSSVFVFFFFGGWGIQPRLPPPLLMAPGTPPPRPRGTGQRWPNPRARLWGKGEEEGAAPPSETQRDALQPWLHGDAGEGERAPKDFLPPLTWARLTWAGAAGTPRQGVWAPSRSSSARPGVGSGRHDHRPGCEGHS